MACASLLQRMIMSRTHGFDVPGVKAAKSWILVGVFVVHPANHTLLPPLAASAIIGASRQAGPRGDPRVERRDDTNNMVGRTGIDDLGRPDIGGA